MESIISNEYECLVCGDIRMLHKHHIFYGTANRKQSEKYGCWCYLCDYHHNKSGNGVHFNRSLDLNLKRHCQKKWEEIHGDREEFIRTFGKSYL